MFELRPLMNPRHLWSFGRKLRERFLSLDTFSKVVRAEPDHSASEAVQRIRVARDPVVREVASELLTQGRVLLRQRVVATLSTPVRDGPSIPYEIGSWTSCASPPSDPGESGPSSE